MRLKLRVRPKVGEGAAELALRLAARHEYKDLKEFLSAHKIRLKQASFTSDIERIAHLAGFALDTLSEWTIVPLGAGAGWLRGENLSLGMTPRYRRFCPVCWDEDLRNAPADEPNASTVFIRAWWRISLLYACPFHHCAMVDSCPSCGLRIPIRSLPLDRCKCGFKLSSATPVLLSPDNLKANEYVAGRLNLIDPLGCPALDRISLIEVGNVLRRLGSAAVLGRREEARISVGKNDKEISYDKDPVELAHLLSSGFRHVEHGAESFRGLLSKLIEGRVGPFRGPSEMFGMKFRAWAIHEKNPIRDIIDEVWSDFIYTHSRKVRTSQRPKSRRPLHLASRPQMLHPLEQARFEIAIGKTFDVALTRKQAHKIGKMSDAILTKVAVASLLGPSVLARLTSLGMITPTCYSDVSHAEPYFKSEIMMFLHQISSRARRPDRSESLKSMFFSKTSNLHVPFLLSGILNDEVLAFCPSDDCKLKDYLVEKDGHSFNLDMCVSRSSAATTLGVNPNMLDEIMYAYSEKRTHTFASNSFNIMTIYDFNEIYISALRLAGLTSSKMRPAMVTELLIDSGLEPLISSSDNAVFPRQQAISAFYANWKPELEPAGSSLVR